MKTFMFVFVTIFSFVGISQYENTSFYFSIENLEKENSFDGFDTHEIGFYEINEAYRRHLMVDRDSISVRSGFEIIISKAEAIDKGFSFKENKMYGMEPYNGIHYEEVNDTIVALYFQFDHYFGNRDLMIKGDKGYFLFTEESNSHYSCEYITFENDEVFISSIDHSTVMKQLQKISPLKEEELNNIQTFISEPSLKELEQFVKKDCFNDLRSYPKVEHL